MKRYKTILLGPDGLFCTSVLHFVVTLTAGASVLPLHIAPRLSLHPLLYLPLYQVPRPVFPRDSQSHSDLLFFLLHLSTSSSHWMNKCAFFHLQAFVRTQTFLLQRVCSHGVRSTQHLLSGCPMQLGSWTPKCNGWCSSLDQLINRLFAY